MANVVAEQEKVGVGLIRIADLPADVQAVIQKLKLDKDGDGTLCADELGVAFKDYRGTKKDNKNLRYSVGGLVLFSILLICCVFGASITAARLSKDTSVDPVSGIMYQKGSNSPIQTEPIGIRYNGVMINKMPTYALDVLREISLDNGLIKFQVKGYVKSLEKKQVTLIVEDGSLLYGDEGLVAATGMAETMLDFVYLNDVDKEGRRLFNIPSYFLPNEADVMSGAAPIISDEIKANIKNFLPPYDKIDNRIKKLITPMI